jgi:hypothetical protein
MMDKPKYPHVKANVTLANGDPHVILRVVSHALRDAGVSVDEVRRYGEESVTASFDDLPAVAARWVTVL